MVGRFPAATGSSTFICTHSTQPDAEHRIVGASPYSVQYRTTWNMAKVSRGDGISNYYFHLPELAAEHQPPFLVHPLTHSLPYDIYQQHLQKTTMYSKVTNIRSNDSCLGNGWRGDFINIFPLYVRTSKTTPDSSVYSTHHSAKISAQFCAVH